MSQASHFPASAPTHGESRYLGMKTIHAGEPVKFKDLTTGKTFARVPSSTTSVSVAETYCGHCQKWIKTNGVLGPIRFMAEHQDGDCSQ